MAQTTQSSITEDIKTHLHEATQDNLRNIQTTDTLQNNQTKETNKPIEKPFHQALFESRFIDFILLPALT